MLSAQTLIFICLLLVSLWLFWSDTFIPLLRCKRGRFLIEQTCLHHQYHILCFFISSIAILVFIKTNYFLQKSFLLPYEIFYLKLTGILDPFIYLLIFKWLAKIFLMSCRLLLGFPQIEPCVSVKICIHLENYTYFTFLS